MSLVCAPLSQGPFAIYAYGRENKAGLQLNGRVGIQIDEDRLVTPMLGRTCPCSTFPLIGQHMMSMKLACNEKVQHAVCDLL